MSGNAPVSPRETSPVTVPPQKMGGRSSSSVVGTEQAAGGGLAPVIDPSKVKDVETVAGLKSAETKLEGAVKDAAGGAIKDLGTGELEQA
jgi:hypothetical protein